MASLEAAPVSSPEPPDPGLVATAMQEIRHPPEPPDPPDESLYAVFSVSRLLIGSSRIVSKPYTRLVFPNHGSSLSALDSHDSNGTSWVFVDLNKLGLCSSSSASPPSKRFEIFIEGETMILLDQSVSDSVTASLALVQIFHSICSSCFNVDVEQLDLARFGLCSMVSLSQVSKSLMYSTHEKLIGLASLLCLTWEPIDYTPSTVVRSLVLGKSGSFLFPIALLRYFTAICRLLLTSITRLLSRLLPPCEDATKQILPSFTINDKIICLGILPSLEVSTTNGLIYLKTLIHHLVYVVLGMFCHDYSLMECLLPNLFYERWKMMELGTFRFQNSLVSLFGHLSSDNRMTLLQSCASNRQVPLASVAQAFAFKAALIAATNAGFRSLMCFSDSVSLDTLLNSINVINELKSLLNDICCLNIGFKSISFVFIPHSAIVTANALVKSGLVSLNSFSNLGD